MDIVSKIKRIADEKNAVILAHNYQPDEIQEIAHYTGDSLELARIAAKTDADIIVFCGVYFMAESAKILSPRKKVLIPDKNALCPMAQMATPDKINKLKKIHPDAKVVTYINSTAETKSVSDVCCTSSNAIRIVENVDSSKIIFVPDKNLGSYVAEMTNKEVILWDGYCPVHNSRTIQELNKVKKEFPEAEILMHPECPKEIRKLADKMMSTGEMASYVKKNQSKKYIIATENGMIYKLISENSNNKYFKFSEEFICDDMKKITLEKLYNSLFNETEEVNVPEDIAQKAAKSLNEMLRLS